MNKKIKMSIGEMHKKCCNFDSRHKKIAVGLVVILAGIILLCAVTATGFGWKLREKKLQLGFPGDDCRYETMMSRGDWGRCGNGGLDEQFIAPQDAAKSGEIAIEVANLDNARQMVSDIAAQQGGSVYSTKIAYASNNLKNGSIVVQVPVDRFETVFESLKAVGLRIVQESTQQIPQMMVYPMMQPAASTGSAEGVSQEKAVVDVDGNTASSDAQIAQPEIATMPSFYRQPAQDKGYVKIVFVENKKAAKWGAARNNDFDISSLPIAARVLFKFGAVLFLLGFVIGVSKYVRKGHWNHREKRKASIPAVKKVVAKKAVKPVVRRSKVVRKR